MSNPQWPEQQGQQYPAAPPPPPPGQQQPGPQQPYGAVPQPGYGPAGYPPAAPQLSEEELRKPNRPTSLTIAFVLWLIGAIGGLLAKIITMPAAGDALGERAGSPGTGSQMFGIVLSLITIGAVFAMYRGQNWARIVLTVIGSLVVLISLLGLVVLGTYFAVGGIAALAAVLLLLQLLTTIPAIVLMYTGGANHYYRAQ